MTPLQQSIVSKLLASHASLNVEAVEIAIQQPSGMPRVVFEHLQALYERMEADVSQGRECVQGFDDAFAELGRILDASPWQMHPDYGCVLSADIDRLDDEHRALLLPPWATGRTESWTAIGAQLCTKDGRRIGNAVTVREEPSLSTGARAFAVVTDVGSTMLVLTVRELHELFHQPKWTMDISTHPGVQRLFGSAAAKFAEQTSATKH